MGSVRSCHQKTHGNLVRFSSRSTFKTFHHRQASLILSSMARSRHSQEAWWCLFRHCWRWYCTLNCFGSYEKWPKNIKNRFDSLVSFDIFWLRFGSWFSYYHTSSISMLEVWRILDVLAPMTLVKGASFSSPSVLFGTCFKAFLKC